MPSLKERFIAGFSLAGCGDAMGYNKGEWEFCRSGQTIHREVMKRTENQGVLSLSIDGWKVSDDQVMHLATGEGMKAWWNAATSQEKCEHDIRKTSLFPAISKAYVACWDDMDGRAPGMTTGTGILRMERSGRWDAVNYSGSGGGCGGAMRTMCIGMVFFEESEQDNLIACGIEAGRMTHNHPTGFFGSLVSALFTAFALRGVPVQFWGCKLVNEILPKAYAYLKEEKRDYALYEKDLLFFEKKWSEYLKLRGLSSEESNALPVFPQSYDVKARDKFYSSISYSGWGGASGDDSVIIAYDALLGCIFDHDNYHHSSKPVETISEKLENPRRWAEYCLRGVLHGGDSDSTGVIGAVWYGCLFGLVDVPQHHYEKVEYNARAVDLAKVLFDIYQQRTKK